MSGSDGGGDLGGGGGGGGRTPCDQLSFEASLASPSPAVIAGLAINASLDVRLQQQPGGALAVVAIAPGGAAAGAIATRVPELLRCLQAGNFYQAVVLSVAGGSVRVRIEPI
jgi:hypothetical protein